MIWWIYDCDEDDNDDNDATSESDAMMNDCNGDCDGFSVGEPNTDGPTIGLSAIGEENRIWELPSMTNFGFIEIGEYALSSPYTLSSFSRLSISQ